MRHKTLKSSTEKQSGSRHRNQQFPAALENMLLQQVASYLLNKANTPRDAAIFRSK